MLSPWKYFSLIELKCKCGNCESTGLEMDDTFMEKLSWIREELGFPFIISSAYRCGEYNKKVSGTGENGPHTTGKAIDIVVNGEKAYALLSKALLQDFKGIGINQKGNSRFIHLDDLEYPDYPRPMVWSY